MTGRDRMVLMGILVLVVLAGGWLLLVSPERKQAAQAQTQIESARQQLQSAQSQAASDRSAEERYASAYVSVVRLGKAVPPLEEVPSLVYELDQATHQRSIEFNSISSQGASGASSTSGSAAATTTAAAFTQMPFTFVFKGSFFQLAHLLGQIDGFARTTTTADASANTPTGIDVSGRLLTIQGVTLTPEAQSGLGGSSSPSAIGSKLSATITATAYVLPASQGLTGGATPAGPAAGGDAAAASSAASSSSTTSPAVIQERP